MATPAEPFTSCHYCELAASTKHRSFKGGAFGRRRVEFIYACFMHGEQARRDARASRHA